MVDQMYPSNTVRGGKGMIQGLATLESRGAIADAITKPTLPKVLKCSRDGGEVRIIIGRVNGQDPYDCS